MCVLVAMVLVAAFSISPSGAQRAKGPGNLPLPDKPNLGSLGQRVNADTIAIASGNLSATYLIIAYERSVLDDEDNFRVLPVAGKGVGQNIRDVSYLKRERR
jgi:hypothetical protein